MMSTPPADVVLVSPPDRSAHELASILLNHGWTVNQIPNCFEALAQIQSQPCRVVIATQKWREMLALTAAFPNPPNLIVSVAAADEILWAEVLNLGGYDVIVQPFDPTEVTRIIQAAERHARRACVSLV